MSGTNTYLPHPHWELYDWHPLPEMRIFVSDGVERLQQKWGRQYDFLNWNEEWRNLPKVFEPSVAVTIDR
jgi:hypothetical protein